MAVETDSDRAVFFDTDDFGVSATYTKAAGGSADIGGLFLNAAIGVTVFEHAGGIDRQPAFVCRESDVPAGAAGGDSGDTLTIDAVVYRVVSLRPDGTGMIQIDLGKSA